jgi:hypothetical protein
VKPYRAGNKRNRHVRGLLQELMYPLPPLRTGASADDRNVEWARRETLVNPSGDGS